MWFLNTVSYYNLTCFYLYCCRWDCSSRYLRQGRKGNYCKTNVECNSHLFLKVLEHNYIEGITKVPLTTGSRSTFEFPSRVNLSGPSLYCIKLLDRTSWCNKVDAVRLYASYRLNLLWLQGQICMIHMRHIFKETVFICRSFQKTMSFRNKFQQ